MNGMPAASTLALHGEAIANKPCMEAVLREQVRDGEDLARAVVEYFACYGEEPVPDAMDGDLALLDQAKALLARLPPDPR